MKKYRLAQGFATLTPFDVKKAITAWLADMDPPLYCTRVESVDKDGASVLLWSEEKQPGHRPKPPAGTGEDTPAWNCLARRSGRSASGGSVF